MAVETMSEIIQQVTTLTSALSSNEKLKLASLLIELSKRDATNGGTTVTETASKINGTVREPLDDVPDRSFRREYEWLARHRHEYPGQYLLIEGEQLVSHGADLRQALAEARQAGAKYPLMVRVEAEDELPFGGW